MLSKGIFLSIIFLRAWHNSIIKKSYIYLILTLKHKPMIKSFITTVILTGLLATHFKAKSQTLSRLIAISKWEHDGTKYKLSDTESFTYCTGRGGDDYYNLPYDQSLSWRAKPSGTLDSNLRNEKTYNSAGKITTHKQQLWTNPTMGWMNAVFTTYDYDAANNETEQTIQRWDYVSNVWKNQDHIIKTYDLLNNIITNTTQTWNVATSGWKNSHQVLNTFDSKKNKTSITIQYWDAATWRNDSREVYDFDSKDNLLVTTRFKWNNGLSKWDSAGKTETTYSVSSKKLVEKNYTYDAGTWKAFELIEYTYNASDSLIQLIYKDWKDALPGWSNKTKFNFTYDISGKLIKESAQRGLNDIDWENHYQKDYEYDIVKKSNSYVHSSWNNVSNKYDSSNKITREYNTYQQITKYILDYWNSSSKVFIPVEVNNFYYEEYTSNIKEIQAKTGVVSLYPVPAGNVINLSVTWNSTQDFSILIYDINGRVIDNLGHKNQKEYSQQIDLSKYANGQYFISIVPEQGGRISRSFSVQK